jgi:hypothetical protein
MGAQICPRLCYRRHGTTPPLFADEPGRRRCFILCSDRADKRAECEEQAQQDNSPAFCVQYFHVNLDGLSGFPRWIQFLIVSVRM